MPQFCSHCGSIETPTWRKLYIKDCEGKPGPLDSVAGEGEIVAVKVTEHDDEGVPTKFQILKTMKKTKDMVIGKGFEYNVLCNPCGLWFNKYGNMRPPEKWGRKHGKKAAKEKKGDDGTGEPASEAFYSEQVMPEESTRPGAAQLRAAAPPEAEASQAQPKAASKRTDRQRASSVQPQTRRATSDDGNLRRPHRDPEYMRAIQSSPVRSQGSEASPIEVDLTPNPTRRLLFPSPRRDGEEKSLDDGDSRPKSASPSRTVNVEKTLQTAKVVSLPGGNDVNVFETFTYDKENMAPPFDEDNEFSHLFDGSPGAAFKTPARKTPAKRNITPLSQKQTQMDHLLKTPTQNSRKRKPLTPNANAANNADMNMNVNDFMTSPSSSRYFLRSTPSRVERTPGGRTISNGGSNEASPFSRHLAQMLNDADTMNATFTSPSRDFDFSDLPTFTTPGREVDWKGLDDIMSSDFASYDDGSGMAFSTDVHQPQL